MPDIDLEPQGGGLLMKLAATCVVLISALSLSGCVGTAIRAQTNQPACEAYGYTKGTKPFADCMLRLEEQAQTRRAISILSTPTTPRQCTYNTFGNTTTQTCR